MKKWMLIMALALGLMGMAPAQEVVEVSANVQSETVAVGKPFFYDLMLKVPYGYSVIWNEFDQEALSEQINIVERGSLERSADADSNTIVQQRLTLMTFDTGYVQIPPVGLAYAKVGDNALQKKAFTDPVQLYVTTITVDTTQTFRPIVPPVEKPLKMEELFPWILGALLLILIGIAVWLILKRRKPKQHGYVGPVRLAIPPYNKAINDLDSLKQQKLWQADRIKEYYSGLTDIAREYIEGQFGVNAVEMTTDDILLEVKSLNFDEQVYQQLRNTMQLADLVKFAKYTTSPFENDNAMNDMVDFVNGSYQHYLAMQAKVKEEVKHV